MKGLYVKAIMLICVALGASGAFAGGADEALAERLKADFRAKGIAGLERLEQDPVQAACTSRYRQDLPPDMVRSLEAQQLASIRYPADGQYLGDWKKGEALAQDGRGNTWSDGSGSPVGGNCYNCHQLAPEELSFGTIGPSLRNYGRIRGNTNAIQRYTFGRIYNAKAYNLCTNMPRFGHMGALTEDQIKDLVALLLDPASPVNQ